MYVNEADNDIIYKPFLDMIYAWEQFASKRDNM